jgi:hypothetical protein
VELVRLAEEKEQLALEKKVLTDSFSIQWIWTWNQHKDITQT